MFYHLRFQKIIQKACLILENSDQLSDLDTRGYVFGFDWSLSQLIVLLKPDFNCWSNFALSWIDKVTAGT